MELSTKLYAAAGKIGDQKARPFYFGDNLVIDLIIVFFIVDPERIVSCIPTSTVRLNDRMTYVALALALLAYDGEIAPDDVAVLSLPDNRLFRLSDVPDQSRLAAIVAANLDQLFVSVEDEIAGRIAPPEIRPGSSLSDS
ncbi:hypothetical protein [Phenylobacterium sp. J367]|uniref:hypothetical protein n=1 Tax=Phenylobacterium sp. J367 TaxID=2898435 RepID=UPI002150D90B|nr:hypothetical protein [Phenylobacterium sp. J367]MCR5878497.1 hypothetical protein [Phenylobacterium sp. J367]